MHKKHFSIILSFVDVPNHFRHLVEVVKTNYEIIQLFTIIYIRPDGHTQNEILTFLKIKNIEEQEIQLKNKKQCGSKKLLHPKGVQSSILFLSGYCDNTLVIIRFIYENLKAI